MDQRLLSDRVAIVVGVGTPGDALSNGRATALEFARAGANLVLADKSAEALAACADAVKAEGGRCLTAEIDATNESDIERLVDRCKRELGGIDILHNNLGIAPSGRLTRAKSETFDLCIGVNLKSVFLLSKHVLPVMEQRSKGVVTSVSSISSIRHLGISSPLYDMAKAGLNALSRHIAVDYGPKGIRSNVIILGMMDTPLARGAIRGAGRDLDDLYRGYAARIPSGRMGTGIDTANLATFLASDLAAYVNGAEIVLDGGLTVRSG